MKYQSGDEIRKNDNVLFHGEPGEIEFVLEEPVGDPSVDWLFESQGPGVMILEPKHFGRVYLRDAATAEDLVLVSRTNRA
jgi:hypothetical protein